MPQLSPKELVEEWGRKKTRPVYYLHGEEAARKEAALRKLQEYFKPEPFNYSCRDAEISDVAEAIDEAQTSPMLADTRFVVIKKAEKLKKEPLKQLQAYLASPCPSACMIILADYAGKADALAGALPPGSASVDFSPMDADAAQDYLNRRLLAGGVKTDTRALALLVEGAGTASAALDSEADKIIIYMHGQDRVFDEKDAAALAGFGRNLKPFALSEALGRRDPRAAAEAALNMLENGEEPLGLLAQTSKALGNMLKARRAEASGEGQGASYAMGMSPGQFFHAAKAARNYTEDKLLRSLRRCLEAEETLKSSARRDPSVVIRQLLLEITSGR